jgi:plasmid stabilization system protein ParE
VAIILSGSWGPFGLNFPVVLTVIAADDFHGSANLYGAFNVAPRDRLDRRRAGGRRGGGAAAYAGSSCSAPRSGRRRPSRRSPVDRVAFLGLLTAVGFSNLAFQTVANSAVQLWTAPEMRGQVLGVYGQVFVGGTPIGAPIVGAFTEHVGGRAGMAACGVVPLAAAVLLAVALAARSWQHGRGAPIDESGGRRASAEA